MLLRGPLPNVPAAGRANAVGSNQKFWSSPAPFATPCENERLALLFGSPTWLYGLANASPTPATSVVLVTHSGVPERMKVDPEICHPPAMRESSVFWSFRNGRS